MIISGNSLDYWENIFKKFNHLVEQSPVNISTKNIQKRYLPPLNYSKRDFNKTVVEIINTGHTGIIVLVLFLFLY